MLDFRVALEGRLDKELDKERDAVVGAWTRATRTTGATLRDRLRAQTRRGGLGRKLEKAWRVRNFPARGNALEPATFVYSKARRIHAAFDRGGIIRVDDANYLVIPTAAAIRQKFHLSRRRSQGSRPRRYSELDAAKRRFGKLRFVRIDQDSALIIADNATKTGRVRKSTRRRRKGDRGVVLFTLHKQIRLRRSLDINREFNGAGDLLIRNVNSELTQDA